mmetsp:Transcript_75804/g.245558  ORF Transcript_75804/g.245558 Transcript_75804/m.245558 type:complete len:83 (-) Transcript_75804:33-281(-)
MVRCISPVYLLMSQEASSDHQAQIPGSQHFEIGTIHRFEARYLFFAGLPNILASLWIKVCRLAKLRCKRASMAVEGHVCVMD